MKRIILSAFILGCVITGFAQGSNSEAFSKSYTYESKQDYANAIAAIEKVYDENSYSMNLRLGWLNYLAGEYTKSQTYYQKAIKLETKSVEARLGYAYPASAMNNWDDVIRVYNEVLAIDPNNSVVNYRLASIYYYRKDFEKAVAYCEKVLNLYPFDFDSNVLLAQIYIGQGKIKEARISLLRALYYNPDSTEVKNLLEKI